MKRTDRDRYAAAMRQLTLVLTDSESDALTDLADALGAGTPEDLAREAVRATLSAEEARTRASGERLAARHAGLLRRLGE